MGVGNHGILARLVGNAHARRLIIPAFVAHEVEVQVVGLAGRIDTASKLIGLAVIFKIAAITAIVAHINHVASLKIDSGIIRVLVSIRIHDYPRSVGC